MAHKTFISYKYSEARDLRDKIVLHLGKDAQYYEGETAESPDLTDEKTDVKAALENYKKENPQYFGDTVIKKVQTSPTLNNTGTQGMTTNDIMNNILRNSRGE